MQIKKIVLKNFRNFSGEHIFELDHINLITGSIGVGKSTLGRISIAFALYGDADNSLSLCPTRGKSDSCTVELYMEDNENKLFVSRSYPTELIIRYNDVEIMHGANTRDKERWLWDRIGDREYFKRFRMIDLKQGINILDEGPTALRKILVSFQENKLNLIKKRLSESKTLYEKYNKDSLVIYRHHPSIRRLKVLSESLAYITNDINALNIKKSGIEGYSYQNNSGMSVESRQIQDIKNKFEKINKGSKCPTCEAELNFNKKHEILVNLKEQLEQAEIQYNKYRNELELNKKEIFNINHEIENLRKNKDKINYYKQRIETRIKQIDYKYTNKDILLVTNAIKQLEKFYSFFIITHIRNLEPIINNILNKIDFEVKFKVNTSGAFTIQLIKNNETYDYNDLSSGQKLMLSIAFQIAILFDRGDCGFIIADEGFGSLDEKSATDLFNLLKNLPFQIISILHRFSDIPEGINLIKLGELND